MDQMHSVKPMSSPQHIQHLYALRYNNANSSFQWGHNDKLHANCTLTPEKREQIRHTTKSLENMFEQLLQCGSVSSFADTELNNVQMRSFQDSDMSHLASLQFPHERATNMNALTSSSESSKLLGKPGKGRFASRNVPKSKTLQTLEIDLDEGLINAIEQQGEFRGNPSVPELRFSKSLSKLNAPDWLKNSSSSGCDSAQSLFKLGSTSTSSSPSVTPISNTVIIQKRAAPSPTNASARLLRASILPTTHEKAPIYETEQRFGSPSDKCQKRKEDKEQKPMSIVPFAKLHKTCDKSDADLKSNSYAVGPTQEKPTEVRLEPNNSSKLAGCPKALYQPTQPTTEMYFGDNKPMQNERTASPPPPPVPERKPILANNPKQSECESQQKRNQVHFSDETQVSNQSQGPNSLPVRQNGAGPNKNCANITKPQEFGTSFPLPQFRFSEPGTYASKTLAASQNESSQNTKGNNFTGYHGNQGNNNELYMHDSESAWLHKLQLKAKTDGESLFEFLQKRHYSNILENDFAEQLDELQDQSKTYNFQKMAIGKRYTDDNVSLECSLNVCDALTNNNGFQVQNGCFSNSFRTYEPVDDLLDRLLLLDGYQTGRMRMDENGLIVPRTSDYTIHTPDTPPDMSFVMMPNVHKCIDSNCNGNVCDDNDLQSEYTLVQCENPECRRETNLKEARKQFKSCHNCFSYYCGRICRKLDWKAHKRLCIYSKINSACKHVIKFINRVPHWQYQCSRIARRGYLSQGRGCVVFPFPDISSAEDFIINGMESLWIPPLYICLKELSNATMLGSKLNILVDTCKQYNPELKYVIHVAIVIPQELPTTRVPRRREAIIQKCAKLRLSPAHMHSKQENPDIPSTLILTAVPGNQHADDVDGRKTRELCFVNIQRKLRNRGVSLRHHFPDIYNKLIDFVSDAKHFTPLIIYPRDSRTGKKFMCVIMPEAEPEIEWITDPDLFHELGVFDKDDVNESTPNLSIQLYRPEEIM